MNCSKNKQFFLKKSAIKGASHLDQVSFSSFSVLPSFRPYPHIVPSISSHCSFHFFTHYSPIMWLQTNSAYMLFYECVSDRTSAPDLSAAQQECSTDSSTASSAGGAGGAMTTLVPSSAVQSSSAEQRPELLDDVDLQKYKIELSPDLAEVCGVSHINFCSPLTLRRYVRASLMNMNWFIWFVEFVSHEY